jgi:hypothetical protein
LIRESPGKNSTQYSPYRYENHRFEQTSPGGGLPKHMIASGESSSRIMKSHSPCRSLSAGPRGVLTGARTRTDNIPDFIDESYARM